MTGRDVGIPRVHDQRDRDRLVAASGELGAALGGGGGQALAFGVRELDRGLLEERARPRAPEAATIRPPAAADPRPGSRDHRRAARASCRSAPGARRERRAPPARRASRFRIASSNAPRSSSVRTGECARDRAGDRAGEASRAPGPREAWLARSAPDRMRAPFEDPRDDPSHAPPGLPELLLRPLRKDGRAGTFVHSRRRWSVAPTAPSPPAPASRRSATAAARSSEFPPTGASASCPPRIPAPSSSRSGRCSVRAASTCSPGRASVRPGSPMP